MNRLTPLRRHSPFFVLDGLEGDGLEIGSGVRFRQDHGGQNLTGRETRQDFRLDLLGGPLVDRAGVILVKAEVQEGRVGAGEDFRGDGDDDRGHIESPEFPGEDEAHEIGLGEHLHGPDDGFRIGDDAVLDAAFCFVDFGGIGRDEFGRETADDIDDAPVVVLGVFDGGRRMGERVPFREIVFADADEFVEIQMFEMKENILVVR